MPTVRANGLEMHYTTEGAGPPLVLLHGASSTAEADWAAQRPLFRQAFHLYLLDARGHGRTVWDGTGGWSADALVDDLEAFVDALRLDTFHVAGFSMGAMTALRFATLHPERLRTALIAGIDVLREPRTSVARRLMDPERIVKQEPAWAAQLEKKHAAQGVGGWKRVLSAIAADVAMQPLLSPEQLRNARLPILLVYGDRDVFVPADHAVALYRQLPDARLLIVPNSGHVVMVNQPQLFNDAAGAFWRQTETEARNRAEGGRTRRDGAGGEGAIVLEPQLEARSL
jgi:pimeloyl-ACP methyl ester carboxylesterase